MEGFDENKVLEFWEKNKIFEKSILKKAPNGDFTFYDGPPFATGLPHYGHIVASIIKDVVPRFWTMNGFRVARKWGWDCHGLPIENIVEKELNTESKKDIEELGIERFNEQCRTKVLAYVEDWKKVIRKLGRWADMENSYKTMDLDFMESVWWVFKQIYDKGFVYKGYRAMHICPRCETTLSQSEVTEGYKDVKDLSVIAEFRLVDEEETSILAWTTTPWTLIGNVALAVGKNIDYVKIEKKDMGDGKPVRFILAKEKLKEIFKNQDYKIIEEFKGKELVGRKYIPLFDYYSRDENLENKENGWKVYPANFVTTDEGTGVVHIAPAFGEDDMILGEKNNLPFVQHVGMDGKIKKKAKDFAGLHVKPKDNLIATDLEVIKKLDEKGLFFSKEKYAHSYPHCWRCDTPLLNYATSSWFVNVTKIKKQMLETAKKINWTPSHIKNGRWGNWLKGARDWSISRQRFWASVIPIWECECGERKVLGSIKELEKLSGEKIPDLHKHYVDGITFPCKCGKSMRRIPDVLDCWFESGAMPYAQLHYPFENKNKFEKNFPAQFIAEGADQTRCWFYYLHVLSNGVNNSESFKNVIVNGIVLAEDGKKMSKKLNNYPDPTLLMNKYGADALRYYLLTSPVMLADNLNFSEQGVKESYKRINMILFNVHKFYQESAFNEINGGKSTSKNVLDKWIISRLNELIFEVTENMKRYNLPLSARPISVFIDDLSTWYLRQSRERLNEKDKDAVRTLNVVLKELSKVMAPFTPFISEDIYQSVNEYNYEKENNSVHLEKWPEANKRLIDKKLLKKMRLTREIVSAGLKERDIAKIGLKWPLKSADITANFELDEEMKRIIKDQLNVKKIYFDFAKELNVPSIKLNTELTPELEAEGYAREMSRQVQAFRKKLGLDKKDEVKLTIVADEEFKNILDKEKKFIQMKTNSKKLEIVTTEKERFKNKVDFKIKDKRGMIVIAK